MLSSVIHEPIPGWFDWEKLYSHHVGIAPEGGTLVEIGCWHGKSLAFLGDIAKQADKRLEIIGVDHAIGSSEHKWEMDRNPLGNIAGELVANLVRAKVFPSPVGLMLMPSHVAAGFFPFNSIDLVFLDASHDEESLTNDLKVWYPLVKPGGTIAGHDYVGGWPGVVAAVNNFFAPKFGLPEFRSGWCGSCWEVKKPE